MLAHDDAGTPDYVIVPKVLQYKTNA